MSQENVERIRNAFAGTTAGDFSYLQGLIQIEEIANVRVYSDGMTI